MEAEPLNSPPPKRERRWFQFRMWTLMIVVTLVSVLCGVILWGITGQRKLGEWLFGRLVVYKTEFTPSDDQRIRHFFAAEMPNSAIIDWGMFFHTFRGETNMAVRFRLNADDAKVFRSSISAKGTKADNFDVAMLDPDGGRERVGAIDSVYAISDSCVDFVVFCKAKIGDESVYFWADGWPERKLDGVQEVFVPRQ